MPTRPQLPPPGLAARRKAPGQGGATPGASERRGGKQTGEATGAERDAERDAERGKRGEAEVSLRLAIGRSGVGIELARPVRLGCLTVTELTATLPDARFPLDVSGGVARFRHRRGMLSTLQIELGGRSLERWAAPRLRGVVGARTPEVWVGAREAGATVCVSARAADGAASDFSSQAMPIVAFDVDAIPDRGDVVIVVKRARGNELPAPATALAIACASAILGGVAERQGAVFVIRRAARALARALLPEAGARVPAADGMGWTSITDHGSFWILHAARDALSAAPLEEALRAREVSAVLREGDDALVSGDNERARTLYLEALERAPRHGEIARRLLEIDARSPGRAEAALATLAEARHADREPHFGTTPGELLTEIGDVDAAVASFERAGDSEPTPALAARAFELAALSSRDAEEAARWLDRALVRAPRSTTARWLRVGRRLELGRLEDAVADVEHLEAISRGGRSKHAVWLRAGRAWQAAGLGTRAGALFERALRYVPDEPAALAGLGAALVGEGRAARGVEVLTRAVELGQAGTQETGGMVLDLSRALAERLGDLPAAIARVSSIAADAPEAPIARGLEGRWRAALGDVAGAALAFARMRELASSLAPLAASPHGDARPGETGEISGLLVEAAELQRTRLNDVLGAQRHLAAALRLRPRDQELRRAYREIGQIIAHARRVVDDDIVSSSGEPDEADEADDADEGKREDFSAEEAPSAVHLNPADRLPSLDLALAPDDPAPSEDQARAAARVEELTRALHADPRNEAAAEELASLLESLGRGHELLALLAGRLEDATPEARALLAPRARAALTRLAGEAEAAGRLQEAALYRDALESLPS